MLTGDFMPGGEFDQLLRKEKYTVDWPFAQIRSLFLESDLVISNFECPLQAGEEVRTDKSSILGCSDFIFPYLKRWNFHVINLANNHLHDYGNPGIQFTIKSLQAADIHPLGIDSREEGLYHISKFPVKDRWLGLAAFTSDEPWIRANLDSEYRLVFYSRTNLWQAINQLRSTCDLVVILLHWGFEGHEYPSPLQMELARFCIDQGADVVAGHHPHMVQGLHIYKNKPILFSLGHLFFANFFYKGGTLYNLKERNRYGLLVELTLEGDGGLSYNLVPIYQNRNYQIEKLSGQNRGGFLKHLESISQKLDLPPRKYYRFWRRYHFSVQLARLLNYFKVIVKNPNQKSTKKIVRIVKLLFRILKESLKWMLSIKPEKRSRYV